MKQLIVFDIDGTLCDPTHRMHHISTKPYTDDAWQCFLNGACDDPVIEQGLAIWTAFRNQTMIEKDFVGEPFSSNKYIMGFVTARGESSRKLTETWLQNRSFHDGDFLLMRPENDYRKDHLVKETILNEVLIPKYGKPFMVFEDNHDVIRDCWIKNGCYTLDISQGVNTFAVKGPKELT